MKITIVLGPFQPIPPAGFGAVEKIWTRLAREFAMAGHSVSLLGKGKVDGAERKHLDASGVQVRAFRGFEATGRIAVDLCKDFLYALRIAPAISRSDIVVTNSFWLPVVLTPMKRMKGKVVVHVARFPKGQMFLYRGADSIQTISHAVAHAIARQCASLGNRIAVVGYPVDTDLYCPAAGARSQSEAPLFLYVGRVHPEKGVHLLIEAFRRVASREPFARLRIVGPVSKSQGGGGDEYFEVLRSAARGLAVEFTGAVSDEHALSRLYQEASCFCYPSLAEKGEAFGLSVLEAMAAGLPCVVSKLECFEDFLKNNVNGLVFDHRAADPAQALADAMGTVLVDSKVVTSIRERARATAEQYSFARIAEAYVGLFTKVAGQSL